ncbi:MAG TPA: hypothetical protein DCM58_07735 [Desulfovibrio sp.]|jgi:hypothetical protein|nr:hypothetical protein [Desulfovibrio sp.]
MIDLNTLNPEQRHIEVLRRHGARVGTPDESVELNSYFYYNAIDQVNRIGAKAITYRLILPGIDEEMAIAIHSDGHVDSGSAESIALVLDR